MYTVKHNVYGWHLMDERGVIVDGAPSADWLRGYVHAALDLANFEAPGVPVTEEELEAAVVAIEAAECSVPTAAS